jgi:hypothetical protein
MKRSDTGDFLEIIIYVIIMVVGLAASAFRNYSKRKEAQNHQPGEIIPEFPEIDFRPVFDRQIPKPAVTVFEEIFSADLEEEIQPEPVFEATSTIDTDSSIEEVISINDKNISDMPLTEGQAAFESTTQQLISDNISDLGVSLTDLQPNNDDILKNEIGDLQEIEEEEGINLEEAVIYSEILKQKYFTNSY